VSDTYSFRCPNCGAERTAPRNIVGRRVRCAECDALVTAPPEATPRERQLADTWDPDRDKLQPLAPEGPRVPTSARPAAAQDDFDPYYKWLAIPKAEQPPNHYRLLGVPLFEKDFDVISISTDRQMAHVKAQATGRHAALSQRLLNELANACACLLDPLKKQEYDADLKRDIAARKQAKTRKAEKAATAPTRAEASGRSPNLPVGTAAAPIFPPVSTELHEDSPAAAVPVDRAPSRWRESGTPPTARGRQAGSPPLLDINNHLAGAAVQPPPVASTLIPLEDEPPGDVPEEAPIAFRRQREEQDAEMDMTPMVDVTFLLLIFFMVTAAFALQRSKQLPTPEEDSPSATRSIEDYEEDPNVIIVRVDSYNTFHVTAADWEQEAPSEQELLIKLREAREGSGGEMATQLLVIANGEALYERVVTALDAGAAVGMDSIKLVTVEEDDE
jgi:biopolymer transport protein ExbD